jgi:hypothetical protein
MKYRCVATSVEGFVQQLAVAYVQHGYWFYVAGEIPEHKDPTGVDRKLTDRYGIAVSKWARARRKREGLANVHYLRHKRVFVLIATRGEHEFREGEASVIRDIRREPFAFAGYSIGYRKGVDGRWHVSVRIHRAEYRTLKAYLVGLACHRSAENMVGEFKRLRFEPYAPVRRQLLHVLRAVNRARKVGGLEPVPVGGLRLRRRIVKPFEEECATAVEGGRVAQKRLVEPLLGQTPGSGSLDTETWRYL